MQNPASVLTDQFSELLQRLPAGLDLDHLALETKAIQRKRELGDGASLLRLALARGPGGLSLRQTAAWASLSDIAELSNPAVHYRLKNAAGFLEALVVPAGTHPHEVALRAAAIKKGKQLDPRSLIAAAFMILVTSLPNNGYTAKAILAVYRLRWQIELAFKRLKSLLHIDKLPTRTGPTSRSWLHAHLILALLCDDFSQDFLASSP